MKTLLIANSGYVHSDQFTTLYEGNNQPVKSKKSPITATAKAKITPAAKGTSNNDKQTLLGKGGVTQKPNALVSFFNSLVKGSSSSTTNSDSANANYSLPENEES